MTALLVADHDNIRLRPATAQALAAAREMGGPVDILVAGNECLAVAEEAARLEGVRTVLIAQNPRLAQELPEVLADLVAAEAEGYDHVLFAATTLGKAAMPRVAALLDRAAISDIVAVKGPRTFVRGIYAGALLATVETTEDVVVATVRTTAFEGVASIEAAAPIEPVACPDANEDAQFRATALSSSPRRSSSPAAAASSTRRASRPLRSSPTASAPRWAPRALRSTWACAPTTGRSARPAR